MVVMAIVLVGVRVRNAVVRVLMRVGRAGRRRHVMGMIVMPVVVGVLVSVRD
jgi:hypothetical protein